MMHPPRATSNAVALLFLTLALAGGVGCDVRPRAPALRDSSVYQNRDAGLRFLVPQGWTQVASGVLPPGALPAEFMLVKYQMKTTARGAVLEVLCLDDSQSTTDSHRHHAQPSHGVASWTSKVEAQELTVGGVPGRRFQYEGRIHKNTMHKEVVVFRRENRLFSFVGLYWDDDHNAREEIRRAVDSLVW